MRFILEQHNNSIINNIKNNFEIVDKPTYGGFYILPTGESIKVKRDHADIDKYLIKNKQIEPYEVNYHDASKSMDDLNCIRIRARGGRDSWISPYIILPKDRLTEAQYNTLMDWLDFVLNKYNHILIHTNSNSDFIKYTSDKLPEDIIRNIKRYYNSGNLYENIKKKSKR